MIAAYSADSRIGKFNLVLLEDDREFFPDYSAAYVLPVPVAEKYPGLVGVIEKLGDRISEQEMAEMNLAFDEGEVPRDIAENFLREKGLIKSMKKFAKKGKKWYLFHLPSKAEKSVYEELTCS